MRGGSEPRRARSWAERPIQLHADPPVLDDKVGFALIEHVTEQYLYARYF